MGKSTISTGPFSIAMLNYQRVNKNGNSFLCMYKNCKIGLKLSHLNGKNSINYVYIIVPWILFHMISNHNGMILKSIQLTYKYSRWILLLHGWCYYNTTTYYDTQSQWDYNAMILKGITLYNPINWNAKSPMSNYMFQIPSSSNLAIGNPNHKWRFIAGKIIYTWGKFHCHVWFPERNINPKYK